MRCVLAATALLLSACSPEYDWREIRSHEHGYAVMLPGKPASMSRRINLDGLEVPMSMQGAKVGDTAFTVAVADLPDASPATRERALAAMRAGMLRNVGANGAGDVAAAVVPIGDAQGKALGAGQAVIVRAHGAGPAPPLSIAAGFTAQGARAWQWVALGPALDPDQTQTFLGSFKLLRAAP